MELPFRFKKTYKSEKNTRKDSIDKLLKDAGWIVTPTKEDLTNSSKEAIVEFETVSGPADYLLTFNGKAIAIVEAKKDNTSTEGVIAQAKRYAQDIDLPKLYGEYKVPFIYSTDGNEITFQELHISNSIPRRVKGFHTPEALNELLSDSKNEALRELETEPVIEKYGQKGLRKYQKEAVEYAVKRILEGKRKGLVAMATGTGKTFMASALIYHLMRTGYFKRILFLVDRRSLASQAISAFSTFEPVTGQKFNTVYPVYFDRLFKGDEDPKDLGAEQLQLKNLKNRQNVNSFVYVSTIQGLYATLTGRKVSYTDIEDENWEELGDSEIKYNPDFPIDSFDLIISDECHRSIYNKWKYVLDYFDSYQIGLTATPAAHTAAYFDCHTEKDIYYYPYEKAVHEGYLVDFDAVRIQTDIDMAKEIELQKGEAVEVRDRGGTYRFSTFLEDELNIQTASLERKVTVEDRNRKIVQEVLSYIKKGGERIPKTIFYAVNEDHADQLVKLLQEEIKDPDEIQKITYRIDKANSWIRHFRNEKKPSIVVSVDMLSTGVDIPQVENLVLIRPIRSRILYEQIIGRGTRLCNEIGKTHFTVFDAVGVIEFMQKEGGVMEPTAPSNTKSIEEVVEELENETNIDKNAKILANKLRRMDKNITEEGRQELEDRFGIEKDGLLKLADSVQDRLSSKNEQELERWGDANWITFVKRYPRYRDGLIVSRERQAKIVTSEYLFKTTDGRDLKPEDYLESFKTYINDNKHTIQALRILLENPKDFTRKAFNELKEQLKNTPEMFTERRLQEAAEQIIEEETDADLYSFVSYAVYGGELISPQERVDNAFNTMKLDEYTQQQLQWLNLVKNHLTRNVVVEKEDFNNLLTFKRKGGYNKANTDFNGELQYVIADVNQRVLQGGYPYAN